MKKLIIPTAIIFLFCMGCTEEKKSTTKKPANTLTMEKQDKEQIEKLLMNYKESLNASDASKAVELYTKDGIFMPFEAPSAIGTDNIKAAYAFIFSQIQLNIEFYIDEIEVANDFAFATTSSKGTTLIHATGESIPEANRELFIFEKIANEWKIARYMFNKTTPKN